ncbi:MAG: glycoside hydrolase family 5 protein [Halococcoides sp.]
MTVGSGLMGAAAADNHLPPIERDGNKLTADGEEIDLHGINIADPKRVDVTAPARGKTAVQAIEMATDESDGWHANVVRLPVQPVDIGEHPPGEGPEPPAFTEEQLVSYMDDHLEAAVQACADNGAYAIIDYHRHRDIAWGSTNDDDEFSPNQELSDEVVDFWDVVAERYGDMDHVIFEMYNEPQGYPNYEATGEDLVEYWSNWKTTAQPWVDAIREHTDNLVIVGSPRYSQVTFGAVIEEFDGDNLAYALHMYPAHEPTEPADYDDWVTPINYDGGDVPYDDSTPAWEVVPVVMTEWGFDPDADVWAGGGVSEDNADGDDDAEYDPDYGQHVVEWLRTRPVHSTAWVFDPLWDPNMVDFGFETDGDVGTPYSDESIPEKCEELPCEWTVLDGDYMGDTVKEFLANPTAAAIYAGEDGELQPAEVMEAQGDYLTGDAPLQTVLDVMRAFFFN